MGAPSAFELRRNELSIIHSKSITDEDVYKSFRESVEPNGFMRRYLSLAQIGVIIGDTIIVHGSILPTSMGQVPNAFVAFEEKALAKNSSLFQASGPDMVYVADAHSWITQLNAWYKTAVGRWINDSTKSSTYLYSNSSASSPMQHIASGPGSKFISRTPAVGTFLKDRRTPAMIDERVVQYLAKSGINRILSGHQPHGDTPLFIVGYPGEEISKNSFQVFTCDTLYGNSDAYHPTEGVKIRATDPRGTSYATVHVTYNTESAISEVYIQGVTGFNEPYQTKIEFPRNNQEDKFIGRILKVDGIEYIVRLNSATNEKDKYVLTYVDGPFAVMPKVVSRKYLEDMEQSNLNPFVSAIMPGEFNTESLITNTNSFL